VKTKKEEMITIPKKQFDYFRLCSEAIVIIAREIDKISRYCEKTIKPNKTKTLTAKKVTKNKKVKK